MSGATRTLSYVDSAGTIDRPPSPYLALALDGARPLRPTLRYALVDVREIELGRGDERRHRRVGDDGRHLRIDLDDQWMSSRHARLRAGDDGAWSVIDAGSKNGTCVNGSPIRRAPLRDGDVIEVGRCIFVFRSDVPCDPSRPGDIDASQFSGLEPALATLNPALAYDLAALARVAAAPVPMLILGETGTGKEVTARAVHALSGRAGRFAAINCGAIPAGLVESELFGSRRGAFSGASEDRPGLVRSAHGGTLFLDEIGELPQPAQSALLRVLQEREVIPVGGARAHKVDIRVVAATHRDLATDAGSGQFRRDLFARLDGFRIELPPLRDRREDIGLLVAALLSRIGAPGATFRRAAARALLAHTWPLNIRELEQALRAAVALAGEQPIALEHLPGALRAATFTATADEPLEIRLATLLEAHAGNVSAVAREFGVARVQIRRWCKRFDLDPDTYRS